MHVHADASDPLRAGPLLRNSVRTEKMNFRRDGYADRTYSFDAPVDADLAAIQTARSGPSLLGLMRVRALRNVRPA